MSREICCTKAIALLTRRYPRHVSRRRSVPLVIAGQTFAISGQWDLGDGLIPKTIVAYQVDDPARSALDRISGQVLQPLAVKSSKPALTPKPMTGLASPHHATPDAVIADNAVARRAVVVGLTCSAAKNHDGNGPEAHRQRTGWAASPPLCPARHPPQSVAACLSIVARRILFRMGTKCHHLRNLKRVHTRRRKAAGKSITISVHSAAQQSTGNSAICPR